MNIFKSLRLQFRPPKLEDPELGELTFMYISNHPARSYWEAEWLFPPTGTRIAIALEGDESGPRAEFREWYLALPNRFEKSVERAKPELAKVFKDWLRKDLPEDLFKVLKFSGAEVVDPNSHPVEWELSFETTSGTWLGIVIPFKGSQVGEAVIET